MSFKPLRYITGPVSYYGFKFTGTDGSEKTVHLFGDYHYSKENNCTKFMKCSEVDARVDSECQTITLLIDNIAEHCIQNGILFDFFFEVGFNVADHPRVQFQGDYYINDIYKQLLKFIGKKKSTPKNIRIHYADIRQDELFNEIDPFLILYKSTGLMNQLVSNQKLPNFLHTRERYFNFVLQNLFLANLLDAFVNPDYVSRIDDIIKVIEIEKQDAINDRNLAPDYNRFLSDVQQKFENAKNASKLRTINQSTKRIHYFLAQLEKLRTKGLIIKNKNVADIIRSFILDKITKLYTDTYNKIAKEKDEDKKLVLFIDMFLLMAVASMDGYTLARMINFSNDPGQQIIIAYAGDNHILNYMEFFKNELGLSTQPYSNMNVKLDNKGEPERCLDNIHFKDIFPYASPISLPSVAPQVIAPVSSVAPQVIAPRQSISPSRKSPKAKSPVVSPKSMSPVVSPKSKSKSRKSPKKSELKSQREKRLQKAQQKRQSNSNTPPINIGKQEIKTPPRTPSPKRSMKRRYSP